ncbi:MAG: HAD family hydrolase, partial [Bacteroidetes bacterium]|nr:HAD family hydrolase [Bacteroidota bacterium]
IAQLAELIHAPGAPAFSLCTGRAYAYTEAVAQLLGVTTPVLFESGGGMFDLRTGFSKLHPRFSLEVRREIDAIRSFIESVVGEYPGMSMDYAKQTQAAAVGREEHGLYEALERIIAWVGPRYPHHNVFHTHISIDVVPRGFTKGEGLEWLAEETGIPLQRMAFIGDSNGDLPAIQVCGRSFAPSNASSEVKAAVDHAMDLRDIDAVIEAFRHAS